MPQNIGEDITTGASPSPLRKTKIEKGPAEKALARKLASGGQEMRSQMEVELSLCRVREWQG